MMNNLKYITYIAAITAACSNLCNATPMLPKGVQAPSMKGLLNPFPHISKGGSAVCVSGTIKVTANTSDNINFDYDLPQNQIQITQTFVSIWSTNSTFLEDINNGTRQAGGTYDIGATFCAPQNARTSKVQILTHGIGFDRTWWDFAPGYSYADVAVAAGYATLFYDRLGIGTSTKADPVQVVQSPLELEILQELVTMLRNGDIGDHAYTKVIGVGHSYGSALTQSLTAAYPQSLDAAILTSWSVNRTGMPGFSLSQNPVIASNDQPYRFAGLSSGYLVLNAAVSVQQAFFHAPGFDPNILSLADATKAVITIGEYFTTGNTVKPAVDFRGPVAAVAGHEDFAFCSGNCLYPTNILAEAFPKLYPNVAENKTTTYVAPMAGHGLNLHYSAEAAFHFIQNFLKGHGL